MEQKTKKRWKKILLITFVLLVLALIAARLYLPIYLKDYLNRELSNLNGYRGRVESVDVALIRGAYVIHDLKIVKLNSGIPVPFLSIATTDLSIQWSGLLQGRIVSDVHLDRAQLNFAKSKNGRVTQTGTEPDWNAAIKKLMPIDINLVTMQNSKIAYRDFSSSPEVNIYLDKMRGEIRNLRNIDDKKQALPSPFTATGTSIGGGKMKVKGSVNILTRYLDLDGDLALENVDLTAINSYSSAYAAIDFEAGRLDAYLEMVIKDGRVRGYFKPIATNLQIIDKRPKDKNLLEIIWEPIAAGLVEIFSNQGKDQFATRVPFEGHIDHNVDTPFWPQVAGILRNAFVQAFSRSLENDITFSDPEPKPAE